MQICRRNAPLCLVVSLFFLGPSLPSATAQFLGSEFQVNSYTTTYQVDAVVAAGGAGDFVVVWSSNTQDGASHGVFGQRFDAAGSRAGSEFQVNTYTTGQQRDHAVAADGAGNFVVVWQSGNGQDGSGIGIFAQRYSSAGSPSGSEFQVNAYTTYDQEGAAVAADSSGGGFVVLWNGIGQDGSDQGVRGQRFSSSGSRVGSELQVNSYTTGHQWYPAVAVDGSGNFVAVWESNGQDGSFGGVFGQRFNSVGSRLGSEFRVNSYTTNDQRFPAVAADAPGNFVVVWKSRYQDGSFYGVFGQRYDAAGSPAGSEFQVNTFTPADQNWPAVAAAGSGAFVVTWESPQDGSNYGVFGRRFDSAGSPVGSALRVNSYTTGFQGAPAVAADGSGNFIVAWESPQDGASDGVFGQRLRGWLFLGDFELGDVCAWSAAVGSGDVCPP